MLRFTRSPGFLPHLMNFQAVAEYPCLASVSGTTTIPRMDDLTFLLGRLKVFAYLYLKPSLSQVPAAINASHPGSHVRNLGLRPISSTSSSSPSHFNVVHYLSLFFRCSDPPVSLALTAFLPNVSPFQLHSAARMISFQTANPFIYLLFKPFNSLLPPSEEKVKCTNWPTRSSFSLS